jgi:biotin carboxyl carrier protein
VTAPALKPVISVNGVRVEPAPTADIIEVEPGVFSVIVDGESYEVAKTGSEFEIGGLRFNVEVEDPRKWTSTTTFRRREGRQAIKAPMPGKVVRLLVKEGDKVAAGQGLIVVEAMKMQNEMKSPRSGRVASVAVREHEAVIGGSILLMIE